MVGVEQLAVFNEQQGVGHQGRDGVELFIGLTRVAHRVQGTVLTVAHVEAGGGLFVIGEIQAEVVKLRHLGRDAGLLCHRETGLAQTPDELRQPHIAQPDIIRPGGWETDALAGAVRQPIAQAFAVARQELSLQG